MSILTDIYIYIYIYINDLKKYKGININEKALIEEMMFQNISYY